MVRDAVYWAGGAVPYEHDVAVSYFQLPRHVQPYDNVTVTVDIRNVGLSNETNVQYNFTVDGVVADQGTITFMSPGQANTTVFDWTPTMNKTYSLCVEVAPVPNENVSSNNRVCRSIGVREIEAFLLFDQTHFCEPIAYFTALRGVLTSLGYVVDTLTTSPLTASALAGYDVLVLPDPKSSYTPAERLAIQSFVSAGHGLLLVGDSGYSTYTDITSFAGISWTSGGYSGVTYDIVSHDVTEGVTSVYLPSPGREVIAGSHATSLIRDRLGDHVLVVSETPGRVAAFSDDYAFENWDLNTSDNQLLATNLIEWLAGRRHDHDIELRNLDVPHTLERWYTYQVEVEVRNFGLNDETNVTVTLSYDGAVLNTTVIPFMAVNDTELLSFDLVPIALGYHDVEVRAIPVPNEGDLDDNLESAQVLVRDTRPPQTPTNLQARSTLDPLAVELTWDPNPDMDLAYYTIYMSLDGNIYYFEARVYAPACNFTDGGLIPVREYYYRISASDDIPNESPRSSPAIGIPGPDHDGDGLIDLYDSDDDNDGYPDENDDFPFDPTEWRDTDGDGIGDNADDDDDNDGVPDDQDDFPLNPGEWRDSDGDGIGDNADYDDDNDGYLDENDDFPYDPTEWRDTDGDGVGDNTDEDDDGDGIPDDEDEFPLNPGEWKDTDGDGIGDNVDDDDDNDGIPDGHDDFPYDAAEWRDTDGDGIGNNADDDDDGDGISDADDPNPLFPTQRFDLLEAIALWTLAILVLLLLTFIIAVVLWFRGVRPEGRGEDERSEQRDDASLEDTDEGHDTTLSEESLEDAEEDAARGGFE